MVEKQVFDTNTLQTISIFEKIAKVSCKDYYEHKDRIYFIIDTGKLMKALGDNGINVKLLSDKLGKPIKVAEYNPDIKLFIRNLIHPLKVQEMDFNEEEKIITLKSDDMRTKGLIIGAKAQNLRFFEKIVQKYFKDIKELKVV